MKNLYLVVALLITSGTISAQKFWKGSISGEGSIVEAEISIEPIHGVKNGIAGDVHLTQGGTQHIRMEGQQNLLDNINFEVKSGILTIKNEVNVSRGKRVTIYITLPSLTEAAVSGSGNLITTNTFKGLDDLHMAVSGSGNLDMDIEATSASASISGSGSVELGGSSQELDTRISGSGQVHAFDLKTQNCTVAISGSGNANVYTSQSIDARISGSGNVNYQGNAPKVMSRVSGSGSVRSK